MDIDKRTLQPFSQEWQKPSPNDIRAALSLTGLTGKQEENIVGVSERTIRKWTGNERGIPYSSWALLVNAAGLGCIWRID